MKFDRKLVLAIAIVCVSFAIAYALMQRPTGEMTTIKFGDIRGVPNIAQHVALEKGYFEGEGIDAQISFLGAGMHVDAAVSGDIDIGLTSPTEAMSAIAAGAPIKMIGLVGYGEPWRNAGVIVALNGSGIETVEDLRGKRIAVSYPSDVDHLYLLETLDMFGVEDTELVFVLWPIQIEALVGGDVDAVQMIPYYTAVMDIEGIDYTILEKPQGVSEWKDVAVLVASIDCIETKKDDLKKFLKVYYKVNSYLEENPEIHVEYLVKYAGWRPEVAQILEEKGEIINLSPDGRFNRISMSKLMRLMVDSGFIEEEIPLEDLITEELLT